MSFAEKGLDNDRRAEDGEGRKALDLVNIFPPSESFVLVDHVAGWVLIVTLILCISFVVCNLGSLIPVYPLWREEKYKLNL